MNDEPTWRVGELARLTGLTVRTLHHYDSAGLLVPSFRDHAGHRRYTAGDIRRLHHIQMLKSFGLALADIGRLVDGETDPRDLIRVQLDQVNERIAAGYRLRHALLGVLDALARATEPPATRFVEIIEVMTVMDRELTPAQLAEMNENRQRMTEGLTAGQLAEMNRQRADWAASLPPEELAEMYRRRSAQLPTP